MRRSDGRTGVGLAVAAAATLLGLATAAAPAFLSSVGTAMLARELDAAAGGTLDLVRVDAAGLLTADTIRSADAALRADLERHGLPEAVLTLVADVTTVSASSPGRGARLTLLGRQGATDHLPPVVSGGDGVFAMPTDAAARLTPPTSPGDRLLVRGSGVDAVPITVGPLVEAFSRGEMPAFWQPVSGLLAGVEDDPRIPPPPPVAIAEPEHVLAVLAPDRTPTLAGDTLVIATWTSPLTGTPTLAEARELVARAATVRSATVDPTGGLASGLAGEGARPTVAGQGLEAAVGRVEVAMAAVEVPVRLLGLGGGVLAVAGVGVATALGGRRRLERAPLWAARGVAPSAIGWRWSLAAVLPVGVGLLAGLLLAEQGGRWLAPGSLVDATVRGRALPWLALAGLLAVVVVGVTAAVTTARRARPVTGPGRLPPVTEALLVALAGVAMWRSGQGALLAVGGDGVLRFDPLAVALPVLLVAAAAAIGTRAVGLLVRHLPGHGGGRGMWYLASRRLRTLGGATLGLLAITSTAVGLLTFAATLGASVDATVEERTGLLLGADAVLPLPRSSARTADLTPLDLPTTRVRLSEDGLVDGRVAVDVLVIDPPTFAEVAHRPRRIADADIPAATALLASTPGDGAAAGPLPAVWVGPPRSGPATLRVGSLDLELAPVASAPVFPGVSGARPAVVVPDRGALASDDPVAFARLSVAFWPQAWVTGGGLTTEQLRTRLDRVDVPGRGFGPGAQAQQEFTLVEDLRTDPGVAPARETFRFLRGQAALVTMLAALGLLAQVVVRQRRQAVASILATRMGLSPRQLRFADLTEAAVLAGTVGVVGVTAGLVSARVVLPDYDPLPEVALPIVFVPPLGLLPWLVGTAVVGAALTAVASRRAVDRADVASLLRGGA